MQFLKTDFPRTEDGRVYHLGLRTGDIANRIVCVSLECCTSTHNLVASHPLLRSIHFSWQITVGSQSRAEAISNLLDSPGAVLRLSSERGFLTITGRYKDVPISIVSIGMGYPNMDFFVREARESLIGDMVIVRYSVTSTTFVNLQPTSSLALQAGFVWWVIWPTCRIGRCSERKRGYQPEL